MDNVKKIDIPYNNAVAIINRTNQLLLENNIKDSTGEAIAQFEATPANPAWLFALACGSLHTSWQEQLSKAYSALDPQNCEDDQVLVLASIAGIKRGNGKPSHVTVLITNLESNPIEIPIGSVFTETYTNHSWVLNKTTNIDANGQQYVTLYSTIDGELSLPAHTAFYYAGNLSIACESSSSSSGGSDIESISSLRNRISQCEDATNFINQAKNAIELLGGIESCTIWFNSSSVNSLTIGGGTPTKIQVSITNTGDGDITVQAGTKFTDDTNNKEWELFNSINLESGQHKTVTLYSVLNEDITVTNGTNFTYSGELSLTCIAVGDSEFGSVTIPPREAYISIKGYDFAGKVADTFYEYLDVPATVGAQQELCVLGQQPLSLNFDYAEEAPVKIYVTMRSSDMAVGAEGAVKNAIAAHSGTLACGENVTSQMVSEWVQNLGYGTIIDCSVNTPTGMISSISPTEYCVFNSENIFVNAI
jgi:hypothetical protein